MKNNVFSKICDDMGPRIPILAPPSENGPKTSVSRGAWEGAKILGSKIGNAVPPLFSMEIRLREFGEDRRGLENRGGADDIKNARWAKILEEGRFSIFGY